MNSPSWRPNLGRIAATSPPTIRRICRAAASQPTQWAGSRMSRGRQRGLIRPGLAMPGPTEVLDKVAARPAGSLHPADILPGPRVDPDLLAGRDERRDLDLQAGLQGRFLVLVGGGRPLQLGRG